MGSAVFGIAALVHGCGALLYYDGANANAIMGKSRPGDMGFDVVHLNVHRPCPRRTEAEVPAQGLSLIHISEPTRPY